mgnify:CR=1 FL=1
MARENGSGRQKRSQVPNSLRGRALPLKATKGTPLICAAFTAPAFRRMRGPFGPSGVITTGTPWRSRRLMPSRAVEPPRRLEPSTGS